MTTEACVLPRSTSTRVMKKPVRRPADISDHEQNRLRIRDLPPHILFPNEIFDELAPLKLKLKLKENERVPLQKMGLIMGKLFQY